MLQLYPHMVIIIHKVVLVQCVVLKQFSMTPPRMNFWLSTLPPVFIQIKHDDTYSGEYDGKYRRKYKQESYANIKNTCIYFIDSSSEGVKHNSLLK